MEIIGIDLGSNSLRAIKMLVKDNTFTPLQEYDCCVRTAENLEESKEISQAALLRIIQHLLLLKASLQITPQDKIIALTTQAMRKAKNSDFILKEIFDKTQIKFQIISGELEAKITALAPQIAISKLTNKNPKYKQDCFLLIDMGGASSEFILCKQDKILAKSFEIGIVSAKDRYKTLENLHLKKEEFLNPIIDFINTAKTQGFIPKFLMANSGTPTIVCALKLDLQEYSPQKIFGMELQISDFKEVLESFLSLDTQSQKDRVGDYKADVVPFGIALFTNFMESLGFKECVVLDEGLREGAVIAYTKGILET